MSMKTKYALFALCLPIAFTACQNEEFVNVKDYSQELKNRGEIDVILSASYPAVGNTADTRMSAEENGNALSFLWEESTDKLGAALMDEGIPGTVSGAKIYNNYPFIAQSSGATSTFASPSSITKGIYLFYNSYKDVLDREPLSLSLETQVYDPTDVKTPAQQMAKYMNMVAPMVNLNAGIKLADAAAFNLPLEFVNLYTPVKVPVKFVGAPKGTKLTKITINGSSDFVLGGKLNPAVLAGTSNANVLALKDGTIDAKELANAKKAIEVIVQTGANSVGVYSGTSGEQIKGAAELSIKDGMALTNDEVQNFWILIPRGKYTTLKVNAETTNGNMMTKEITVPSKQGEEKDPQEFTSETRALSTIVLDFNAGGNVEQPYGFTINNTTDWNNYIKYVVDHIQYYAGRDITFTIGTGKSVYVTSLPTFGFTLVGGDSDSKLIFGNEDKSAVTAQLDLSGITMGSNVNFEVGEGATVTLRKTQKSGTIAALTNNGTLTVETTSDITALTNNKTLNFKSSSSAAVVMPKVENKGEVNVLGATEFTAFTNAEKATITVEKNAELKLAGSANVGTIVNNGTLTNATGFENKGEIDNYGVLKVVSTFTITNTGKIIVRDGSSSNNVQMTNSGIVEVINPTTYSALTSGKEYNIAGGGTVTAVVTNHKDYSAAKTASMNITLGGGEWSIIATTPADASRELQASDVPTSNKLSLQSDLNVKTSADLSTLDLTVTGTSTITIKAITDQTLTVKSLKVAKGATATIAQGAAVIIPNANGQEIGVDVKGTLINNGALYTPKVASVNAYADVKKFNIEIAANATLTNNATIGGELNTQAVITVNGNLDNAKGIIYGQNKIDNAQSYQRGTVNPFPAINTSATDLSSFAGAKGITATGNVITIPEKTNITFETGTPVLNLAAGNYGELAFTANAAMSASATGAIISKITIAAGQTLTVDGSNDITCNTLVKAGATLTDNNNHLKDADGVLWTSK